jgi:hypothetical protein
MQTSILQDPLFAIPKLKIAERILKLNRIVFYIPQFLAGNVGFEPTMNQLFILLNLSLNLAGRLGFEPRSAESKAAILPLDDLPIKFIRNLGTFTPDLTHNRGAPERTVGSLFTTTSLCALADGDLITFITAF